jgi:hypothetical protein
MVKSVSKPKHNPSKSTPPRGAAPSAKKIPTSLAPKTKKLGLLKGQTKLPKPSSPTPQLRRQRLPPSLLRRPVPLS